jgi:hypothetical protein
MCCNASWRKPLSRCDDTAGARLRRGGSFAAQVAAEGKRGTSNTERAAGSSAGVTCREILAKPAIWRDSAPALAGIPAQMRKSLVYADATIRLVVTVILSSRMKRRAIFVNTSRGPLADEPLRTCRFERAPFCASADRVG